MHRLKLLLSYALIAGGAFFLFQGARDLLESRFGQTAAEREFDRTPPAPVPQPLLPPPSPGDTIGKLLIPRLDAQLYVVEGDGNWELRRGPGHMSGTAMPGDFGNCVIAGHRDTHFRILKDIRRGDDIIIETRAGEYLYRVKSTRIVPPTNTSALQPTHNAELNLITCYPFYYVGAAPKRFVVEAQLAGAADSKSGS
ncbi:MAG: class D sortase [Acidobacteriia bacterium]|nr:class D sortase [Terriglobia bacterium]